MGSRARGYSIFNCRRTGSPLHDPWLALAYPHADLHALPRPPPHVRIHYGTC